MSGTIGHKSLHDMDFYSSSPYVPGYSGHVSGMRVSPRGSQPGPRSDAHPHTLTHWDAPAAQDTVGKSYGRQTAELLHDPSLAKSRTSRLEAPHSGLSSERRREEVLRDKRASHKPTHMTAGMVPGYTGHVPKAQFYTGAT